MCVQFCHICSGWFKHIEPHRTPSKRMILERARCVELCHICSGWFKTSSNSLNQHYFRERNVCTVLSHKFGVVQAHRTSLNPLKAHHIRENKVCRVLSHKFIEPHRTSSKYMILARARCVEFCHISSGWFKHIEPHRIPSKRIILERARCAEFCHISSGWFKHIEPHRTPSKRIRESEVCRALSHKFGVVQANQTSSNPLEQHDLRQSMVCRALSYKFGVVQAHRISSNPL